MVGIRGHPPARSRPIETPKKPLVTPVARPHVLCSFAKTFPPDKAGTRGTTNILLANGAKPPAVDAPRSQLP